MSVDLRADLSAWLLAVAVMVALIAWYSFVPRGRGWLAGFLILSTAYVVVSLRSWLALLS